MIRSIDGPGKRRRGSLALVAALALIAVASSGVGGCGGEEGAVRSAVEDATHGIDSSDFKSIDISGDSASTIVESPEGDELEIELVKKAGEWTIDTCVDEETGDFPSEECPINSLETP